MKSSLRLFISASWLLGFSASVFAQPQQSQNFRITKSVLDAGGSPSSSTNFRLVGAFGQPAPLGVLSSANFSLSAGFLSPIFGVSPLSPIQRLVVQNLSPDIHLNWERISGAMSYTIYRNTDPLFIPGPANLVGTATDTLYTDVNAVNLPLGRYYYIVQSSRASLLNASTPLRVQPVERTALGLHQSGDEVPIEARHVALPKGSNPK